MHYYSRFFELSVEELKVRSDDVVQGRKYRVMFNTLLGEFFVNNLLARYNDRIDQKFYLLPDSAQIFYRRMLIHHSYREFEVYLSKIAEAVGLRDSNASNLIKTVESNILEPLKHDRIYRILREDAERKRYQSISSKGPKIAKPETGREAGSVKEGWRVGKRTRQGR